MSSSLGPGALASALLVATACNAAATATTSSAGDDSSPLLASSPGTAASSRGNAAGTTHEHEEKSNVKIRMTLEDEVLTATLVDNATTRDFVSLLPLTLTLRDYAGTEKVSELPSRLSTEGAPRGVDPTVGDITYYAPWGNLAIFYREFDFAKGLVKLGQLDAGVEKLARKRGEFTVRFEREGGSP